MEINNNIYIAHCFASLSPQDKFEIDGRVFIKIPKLTLSDSTCINAYCLTDDAYDFIESAEVVQKIPPQLKEVSFNFLKIGTVFLKNLTPYLKRSNTEALCLKTYMLNFFPYDEMVTPVKSTLTLDVL